MSEISTLSPGIVSDKYDDQYFLKIYGFYIQSKQFTYEIFPDGIIFRAKENITFEPFQMKKCELLIYISIPLIETSYFLDQNLYFSQACECLAGMYLVDGFLIMLLNNQPKTVTPGTDVFYISFNQSKKIQMVPVPVPPNLLKEKFNNLSDITQFSVQRNVDRFMAGYLLPAFNHTQRCSDPFLHGPRCFCKDSIAQVTSLETDQANSDLISKKFEAYYPYQNYGPLEKEKGEKGNKTASLTDILEFPNVGTRQNALDSLIFAQALHKHLGILQPRDVKNCQERDVFLGKIYNNLSNNCLVKGFVLKQGLLYKEEVLCERGNTFTFFKLAVPASLAKVICSQYHVVKQGIHLSRIAMKKLFSNLFYCKEIDQVVDQLYFSCGSCMLSSPADKIVRIGKSRTINPAIYHVGSLWFVDTCHLVPDNYNKYKCLAIFVENCTGFMTSYPLRNIDSNSTSQALTAFLSFYFPEFIATDFGSEYQGRFSELLKQYKIEHLGKPRSSNQNALSENMVRMVRKELLALVNSQLPAGRTNWPLLIPQLNFKINMLRSRNSIFSRKMMFFSPLHYCNFNSIGAMSGEVSAELALLHRLTLFRLLEIRKLSLSKLHDKKNKVQNFCNGQIVTFNRHHSQAPTQQRSKALSVTQPVCYKIQRIFEDNKTCRAINLLDGSYGTLHLKDLRPLYPNDLIGISLQTSNFLNLTADTHTRHRYRKQYSGLQTNIFDENVARDLVEPQWGGEGEVTGDEETGESSNVNNMTTCKTPSHCIPSLSENLASNLKGIIKHKIDNFQKYSLYDLTESEYRAYKAALLLHQQLGNVLNDKQLYVLSHELDCASNKFFNKNIPVDNSKSVSDKRVQFLEEGKEQTNEKMRLYCYTLRALTTRIKYCVSGRELTHWDN